MLVVVFGVDFASGVWCCRLTALVGFGCLVGILVSALVRLLV